jgi:hypothetical protein
MPCFEQKIAKRRWGFAIKGKSRACLETWCEPTSAASFPLRPSVKIAFRNLGAPGGRAPPYNPNIGECLAWAQKSGWRKMNRRPREIQTGG